MKEKIKHLMMLLMVMTLSFGMTSCSDDDDDDDDDPSTSSSIIGKWIENSSDDEETLLVEFIPGGVGNVTLESESETFTQRFEYQYQADVRHLVIIGSFLEDSYTVVIVSSTLRLVDSDGSYYEFQRI